MNDLIERLRLGDGTRPDHELLLEAADALEALAQPEQEPVGYLSEGGAERLLTKKQAHEQIRSFRLFTHDVPLYTNPPQRTWVELTHSEFAEILCDNRWQGRPELMLLQAQDKLKEKNKCT